MAVVALLTDFGLKDGFVGAVKAVVLSTNPSARIVDLSHEVTPFDVLEGALILKAHYRYFPEGTVFLAVVDPGVGSERLPVVVETPRYLFVGPMNGLFDLVLKEEPNFKAYKIERFTLPAVNATFHGRDVFAPVAGHLSRGLPPEQVGPPVEYAFLLNYPEPKDLGGRVEGEVVYFDRFGNAVTSVPCGRYEAVVFRGERYPVVPYFALGDGRRPSGVCGSFGLMELFLKERSLKDELCVRKGEKVAFIKY